MKKNIKYFMMAAVALLSMSACNNEMDEQQINTVKGEPVKFQMTTTRTSTGTDYTTTFVKGDAVGIFAFERNANGSDGNPAVTNAKYVLSADGTTWEPANPDNAAYADPNIAFNYYAYYPYQEGASTPQSINMAVKLDQSTDVANYNTSDVLTAQNRSAEANSTTVPLNFKHAFALVQVNLEGDASDKDAIVTILNVFPEAALDLQYADGAKAAGEAKGVQSAVKMYSLPEINQIENADRFAFRAIVPAQNVSANTVLLEIQSKGKTYRFTYSEEVKYVAGASRIINVTLGNPPAKNTISFPASNMTVDTWGTTEGGNGSGSVEEVVPIITDFTLPIATATNFTETGQFAKENCFMTGNTSYWFHRETNHTTPATKVTIEDNMLKITTLENKRGSWNNSSIGYHCYGKFEPTIYKVTLIVKSTIEATYKEGTTDRDNTKEGIVGIGFANSLDNKLFKMYNEKGENWNRNITTYNGIINTTPTTKNFYIDLTTASSTGSTKEIKDYTSTQDEDYNTGINIILYNYTNLTIENSIYIESVHIKKESLPIQPAQ